MTLYSEFGDHTNTGKTDKSNPMIQRIDCSQPRNINLSYGKKLTLIARLTLAA